MPARPMRTPPLTDRPEATSGPSLRRLKRMLLGGLALGAVLTVGVVIYKNSEARRA